MNMGCGCSMKILALATIALVSFFVTGLIVGPLGSSLLGIKAPDFLQVSEPHVKLPSEEIFHVGHFKVTNTLIASWLTIIVLATLFYVCTRRMKLIPGRLQSFAEMLVETLLDFVKGVAGEGHARTLFPVVATIFLYVLTNAYLALLPFFGTIGIIDSHGHFVSLFRAANTDINLPLSIALVSFICIEYWGLRALGFFRYLNSFFNLDQLRDGVVSLFKGKIRPAFTGIMFGFINLFVGFLEVFSHFIRIISFTFRLFGNMTAGKILLLVVCFLVPFIAMIPFYGLELLIGFIQALIFAGLTLVFGTIALTPHAEETEHKT